MLDEGGEVAFDDFDEQHLAAAFGTTVRAVEGRLGWFIGNDVVGCNRIERAEEQLHERADEVDFHAAVLTHPAVMARFLKSRRQDMLREPLDKFYAVDGSRARAFFAGRRHMISDGLVGAGLDALVADRHAIDVRGEILERRLAVADGRAVDDPGLAPNLGGDLGVQAAGDHLLGELLPVEAGDVPLGKEKVLGR